MADAASEPAPSSLTLKLFGPMDLRVNGAPLPRLHSRKGLWLLALLALRSGREVERSWLVGTLWPDDAEPQALASLRNTLSDLRRALGPAVTRLRSPTSRSLSLDLDGADVDLFAFDAAIARSSTAGRSEPHLEAGGPSASTQAGTPVRASLEEAVALYRGPLLEGCAEEWVMPERQAREEAYLTALERLARHEMTGGDPTAAADHLRRIVAIEPGRETAQRALMEALAASGNHAAAAEAYRDLCRYLHRELHAEPDPATRALFEAIREQARRRAPPGRSAAPGGDERASASTPPPQVVTQSWGEAGIRAGEPAAPFLEVEEPVGGAVRLGSAFYVTRPVDAEFHKAIARQDSLVLVKGAREMGKSSLLGRGFQQARERGAQVVQTDCQMLSAAHFASAEAFFLAVGAALADQLELELFPDAVWDPRFGASMNFNRYLRRHVLGPAPAPIVWGLDGVDLLAGCDFRSEVFGLFRSWHNQRVMEPDGPWGRLTLVMTYATEAHLLITDGDQSPFNVGTRLLLEDFTQEQVEELNRRYGLPLPDGEAVTRFRDLVGGHPYLVRRGLHAMAARGVGMRVIEAEAEDDDGPFGDHLRRLRVMLAQSGALTEALREVLQGQPCPSAESFYRLRSAGLVVGHSAREARARCRLYGAYLRRHLL